MIEAAPRVYKVEDAQLLQAFREILPEMDRCDLSESQRIVVGEEHYNIVEMCLDKGFLEEICNIRDQWAKVRELKRSVGE